MPDKSPQPGGFAAAWLNRSLIKSPPNRIEGATLKTAYPFLKLLFTAVIVLAATVGAAEEAKQINVTYDNYNQAETARNFNNWAQMGGNNKMAHRKELSPIGPKAPTIRLNLDTLYRVGVFNNDGEMTLTLPETDVYQSGMILAIDGYTPFFFVKPGTYTLRHDSEYLFIAVRSGVKGRHCRGLQRS